MPLRSMTGFAQVKGQVSPELGFTLSLKSVNHRFLDVHFRLPADGDVEASVLGKVEEVLERLNQMREEEGRGIERELRDRMEHVQHAGKEIEKHRHAVLQGYVGRLKTRMQELIGTQAEPERILQEAALLVDRSDIQEELVRLETHVKHFLS